MCEGNEDRRRQASATANVGTNGVGGNLGFSRSDVVSTTQSGVLQNDARNKGSANAFFNVGPSSTNAGILP